MTTNQAHTAVTENAPRVTIVVPAYQAADTISEALASLTAQTYANLEIIVVDDGSTDSTGEIARQAAAKSNGRLRTFRQENAGQAAALNFGWRRSSGTGDPRDERPHHVVIHDTRGGHRIGLSLSNRGQLWVGFDRRKAVIAPILRNHLSHVLCVRRRASDDEGDGKNSQLQRGLLFSRDVAANSSARDSALPPRLWR